jgi:hypothetical protein
MKTFSQTGLCRHTHALLCLGMLALAHPNLHGATATPLIEKAVLNTILKLMTDVNAHPAVRLRAAQCVYEIANKGVELEDIEGRVAALEAATSGASRP